MTAAFHSISCPISSKRSGSNWLPKCQTRMRSGSRCATCRSACGSRSARSQWSVKFCILRKGVCKFSIMDFLSAPSLSLILFSYPFIFSFIQEKRGACVKQRKKSLNGTFSCIFYSPKGRAGVSARRSKHRIEMRQVEHGPDERRVDRARISGA